MALLNSRHKSRDEDTDVNMIPIMNIFLVIIPFLLTSVSFFHIKAINTSVPVLAGSDSPENSASDTIKVTVMVELKAGGLRLSATSEQLEANELSKLGRTFNRDRSGGYPLEEFNQYLQSVKAVYPASDTLLLIPASDVIYDTIVQAMDAARNMQDRPLFPNVVLSGSLG